jgi:two-component system sensor histidine kinase HydH
MFFSVDLKSAPGGARLARILAVAAAMALAGAAQWLVPASATEWRYIVQHLYYLPIVYAGLQFGWKGGLATGLLAGLTCLPQILRAGGLSQYLEIGIYGTAGSLTGVLAERERRKRRASEETARRLSNVYEELQENFERMKRAERLSALGQLSAGLAHEIRNPLASIAGAVGILRRGRSSAEKQAECLAILQKECRRLNRLLTSFLDFARPRALNFRKVEVESVFDSVLGLAEHAVDGASITLKRQVPPGLALDCDPEQLKQVLLNLVINAIQAMPNGGEVAMSASAGAGTAVIQVRDQGCGVSQEEMEHLYDPFFTTKENGTGLGLPVAHQIVAQLGGVLAARNNADGGMTFSVELPQHNRSRT